MKKTYFFLVLISLSALFLVGCGDDPDDPSMEAVINGTEWTSSSISAEVKDDGMTISGSGGQGVTLIVDGEPQYGVNALGGASKIIAGDITFQNGEIYIDEIDYVENIVEGTFYAELGKEYSIKNGKFKNISFKDLSSKDAERDTTGQDTIPVNISSFKFEVSNRVDITNVKSTGEIDDFNEVTVGDVVYIVGSVAINNDAKLTLTIPASVKSNDDLDLATTESLTIQYETNIGEKYTGTLGNFKVTQHNTTDKTMTGTFSITVADGANELDLFRGSYEIFY